MYIPEEAWRRRIPNVKTGVQNPENFDYVFGPAPNTERFQTSKPDSNPKNFDYLWSSAQYGNPENSISSDKMLSRLNWK